MAKKLSLKQDNHARKSSASSFFYKIKNAIERAKVNLIRKVSEIILPYLLPDIVIDDPVSLPKKFSKTKRNIKESIRQNEIR